MRAFEVYVNGKRQCVAGIGGDGVLNAMLDHVAPRGCDHLTLRVGGLINSIDEHVTWRVLRLKIGDEVRVKIIEFDRVDKPRKRHRRDSAEERKNLKRYVRAMAKEFGWQSPLKSDV